MERISLSVDYWTNVVLSDEKEFNLNGSAGISCHWHALKMEEKRVFMHRHIDGDSFKIWADFSALGQTDIAFVSGKRMVAMHCQIL